MLLTQYDSIGNSRRTSIANAKERTPPVARRNVADVSGLKTEKFLKPVSVKNKPNTRVRTSKTHTELELELEGCRHIPLRVLSQTPYQRIRQEADKAGGPFPLTKARGLSLASGQFLLTTAEDNSLVRGPFLHTAAEDSSLVRDLCLHTTAEDNSQARGLYPHTIPVEHCPASALFPHTIPVEHYPASVPSPLTIVVVPCRAPNKFLLITPEAYYPATNLSPPITAVEAFPVPPLPRTIPTQTTGPPTMKLRGKWTI